MSFIRFCAIFAFAVITQVNSLRILGLFPYPALSHFITGRTLLEKLAERGHSVDVVSYFPQKKAIPNYRDISLEGFAPILAYNLTYSNLKFLDSTAVLGGATKSATTISNVCDVLGKPVLQQLIRKPKGSYDVIIAESFRTQCFAGFGRQLEAPVIEVVATKLHDWLFEYFANPLNPSYIPGALSKFSQEMSFWQRLQNTLLIRATISGAKFHSSQQIAEGNKYFDYQISDLKDLYDGVSMVFVNEHFSTSDIRPVTPDIVNIGGLHVHNDGTLPKDLQNWLDESTEGCVYVALGSLIRFESLPQDILDMFYETFKKLAPLRVLLKVSDLQAVAGKLSSNVRVLTWVPQIGVLKHKNVKVFVTHGGLLGTQEAVVHKVPMVGISFYGDQHVNMQNYVSRGIAIHLDYKNLSMEYILNAITTVLKDPTYRANAIRVSELFLDRPMSALDTAVFWVEYTARHGTVLKSPATKLQWWQFYLLDVYGFILICILLIMYVVKVLLTLLWKYAIAHCFNTTAKTKKNQ